MKHHLTGFASLKSSRKKKIQAGGKTYRENHRSLSEPVKTRNTSGTQNIFVGFLQDYKNQVFQVIYAFLVKFRFMAHGAWYIEKLK